MNTFPLEKTKKGFPAIWEEGGAYSNTGDAIIVADEKGKPLTPIYVPHGYHCRYAFFYQQENKEEENSIKI